MKILFVSDQYSPTPGGISVVTNRLSQELALKGHSVGIIAPSQAWKFYTEKENNVIVFRVQSILVHKLKKVRYSPAFLYKKEIRKIITTFHPDIVHIETPDALATAAFEEAEKHNIPVIGTCHIMPQNISGSLPFLPEQIGKFVGNLYMKQLANLFNKIDFVTAPTMTGIAILKANGVTTPMQALSNGIDLSEFHTVSKVQQQHIKKKLHVPNKPLILYVGRLDKEKKVDVLIQALNMLQQRNTEFHAIIAGTGEQYSTLLGLVDELKLHSNITFLGMLSGKELLALYNSISVFVMPSTAELQSLVTMEAMAVGKPVIGARAGALPYLIESEENGYLFTPDDTQDLAEKIEKIITNPKLQKSMEEASRELIRKHDIHVVVSELEKIYAHVVEQYKQ